MNEVFGPLPDDFDLALSAISIFQPSLAQSLTERCRIGREFCWHVFLQWKSFFVGFPRVFTLLEPLEVTTAALTARSAQAGSYHEIKTKRESCPVRPGSLLSSSHI